MTGTCQNRSAPNLFKSEAQRAFLMSSKRRNRSAHRGSGPEPVTLTGSVPIGEPVRTEPVRNQRPGAARRVDLRIANNRRSWCRG
jgi:hypothetical protein